MEFEDLDGKYAGFEIANKIKPMIGGAQAVFVLLGKGVLQPTTQTPEFTHNWINFEVGVAAGSNKRVWVFEDFNNFIKFPIPYVTDYARFNLGDDEHIKIYRELIENIFAKKISMKPTWTITCKLCHAEYNVWDGQETLNCPVCRRAIVIKPI